MKKEKRPEAIKPEAINMYQFATGLGTGLFIGLMFGIGFI